MYADEEQVEVLSSQPQVIRELHHQLSVAWGIDPTRRRESSAIQQDLRDVLFDLAVDCPDIFPDFVADELKRLADEVQTRKVEATQMTAGKKRLSIQRTLHPAWYRCRRGQDALRESRLRQSQAERQCSQFGSEGCDISGQVRTAQHGDMRDEEAIFSREPSPSPTFTPPTPLSGPTTPKKRMDRSETIEQTSPSKRSRRLESHELDGDDTGDVIMDEHSTSDTPSKAAAVELSSLSITSRDLDPSPSPTDGCGSSSDVKFAKNGPSWTPCSARSRDEAVAFIVPSNAYQRTFDRNDIGFHVQWELERVVARHPCVTWDDFLVSDFTPLYDVSATAGVPLVPLVVAGVAERVKAMAHDVSSESPRDSTLRLLAEVDREEQAIRSGSHDGLLSEDPTWPYGGRVTYIVSVTPIDRIRPGLQDGAIQLRDDTPSMPDFQASQDVSPPRYLPFKMKLRQPLMTGKSFRLARKFGSRRVLDIKYHEIRRQDERERMFHLFHGRRFSLFGRTYQAVWSAPDKDAVFAVEVASESIRTPQRPYEPPMPTLTAILDMYNPLRQKASQAMAKWASRPQLLFSDSVPAVRLSPSEIAVVDDITVAGLKGPASTEETLTDGCGLMTEALARRIGARLQSPKGRPFVVQMRLRGAKGLLALMTQDQERLYPGKSVILRQSMVKSLPSSNDPSLYIIDVLRHGGDIIRSGVSLGPEPIICLAHNGVPHTTILEMAKDSLDQIRHDFRPTPHEGETEDDARERLIANVYRQGGVARDRAKQRCVQGGHSLRVSGLVLERNGRQEDEIARMSQLDADSEAHDDDVSGQPKSLHESLMMALESGFDPRESAYACQKLHHFVRLKVDKVVTEYKVPVARSITAFIVPDSLQVLKTDEIFVSFSGEGPVDPATGCPASHLLGDVLVYRSPCKLPTDIRKLRAVYRTELCHLKDCIVMSASSSLCSRSPASYLSGGDYDGDTATVIFDPALVDPFRNADDVLAITPPDFEDENFEKELVKGTDFLESLPSADEATLARNYQHFLLGSILDERTTGSYSVFHDTAVYKLGYDHPETIRLARMFCLVLDARKSGLKLRPEVLKKDQKRYKGDLRWKEDQRRESMPKWNQTDPVMRPKHLGRFIMDLPYESNLAHGASVKDEFPETRPTRSCADFDALSGPYQRVLDKAEKASADLEELEQLIATHDTTSPSHHRLTETLHEQRRLTRQFDRLTAHVSCCMKIWKVAKCGILASTKTIEQHYIDSLDGVALPRRSRELDETATQYAQIRALATVWHDMIKLGDADLLCGDNRDLRRLKISCAAHLAERKDKQIFPFEVDFETTLTMKAESLGPTRTLIKSSAMAMKPIWKSPS